MLLNLPACDFKFKTRSAISLSVFVIYSRVWMLFEGIFQIQTIIKSENFIKIWNGKFSIIAKFSLKFPTKKKLIEKLNENRSKLKCFGKPVNFSQKSLKFPTFSKVDKNFNRFPNNQETLSKFRKIFGTNL
jgi:hypothetical protein